MSDQQGENANQISFELKIAERSYSVVPGNRVTIQAGMANRGQA